MNKEQIIEAIESMTVLELSELVKALEEKFGVSAAAPVAVAGAAAAGAPGMPEHPPWSPGRRTEPVAAVPPPARIFPLWHGLSRFPPEIPGTRR